MPLLNLNLELVLKVGTGCEFINICARCCDVCTKQLYEKCGGLFGTDGMCDFNKDLTCVDSPVCGEDPNAQFIMMSRTGYCMKASDVVGLKGYGQGVTDDDVLEVSFDYLLKL